MSEMVKPIEHTRQGRRNWGKKGMFNVRTKAPLELTLILGSPLYRATRGNSKVTSL